MIDTIIDSQQAAGGTTTRRPRSIGPALLTLLIAGIVFLPIGALLLIAAGGGDGSWAHLSSTILPRSIRTTITLLAYVAVLTVVVGVITAWLIVTFEFPGRRLFAWALVLPFAVPPYLAAYSIVEFFHYTGPIQSLLRDILGYQTARDYWFPDVRSMWGAAFIMGGVLYPYVYLTTRVVFIMQGRHAADVARTLGSGPLRVFWRILLPMARPAIMAGVALVLMETMNDIGAVEFLGVRTLTFTIYDTWLNRGSLGGAAQIACVMLLFIVAILSLEQWARRRQRFFGGRASSLKAKPARTRLRGHRAFLAFGACALPILFGFGIPLYVLATYALHRPYQIMDPVLHRAFFTTIIVAVSTALITVTAALAIIHAVRIARRPGVTVLSRIASAGYALPGTVLGLGLLFVLARIDNTVDAFMRANFDISTGLLLTGSGFAVILACSIRFLALAESSIAAGMAKLPPHLDDAARCLGRTANQTVFTVLLPLIRPAVLTAAVLVGVDSVKELSATILLRPFGFDTLATIVHQNASRAVVEDGAMASLLIMLTAMVPVILLSRALARDETT